MTDRTRRPHPAYATVLRVLTHRYRLLHLLCTAAVLATTLSCEDTMEPDRRRRRNGGELIVGWISRTPQLEYVQNSSNPKVEGWPAEGSTVTWWAHVRNFGDRDWTVPYRWLLDGQEIDAGEVTLPAFAADSVSLPWIWTFERHRLHFELNGGGNRGMRQDTLTIFTDALAVALYVEDAFYDHMFVLQPQIGIHSYTFEHWAQRHIAQYNRMAEAAIYPETPQGVLDRWRLDRVIRVPDGTLPLTASPSAVLVPNPADRITDMQWGFPATSVAFYQPGFASPNALDEWGPIYLDGSLIHELGHARYLIDLHQYDIYHDTRGSRIDVTEDGQLVAGSAYLPGISANFDGVQGLQVHASPEVGLMNREWEFIDRYSAIALNLIAGHRATAGNWNSPDNFGVFMDDMPDANDITLVDMAGVPLAGADVKIYRSTVGDPAVPYSVHIDDTPDIEATADGNGVIRLGRNPFSDDPHVTGEYDHGPVLVVLLRVALDDRVGFAFFEHYNLNLEYWRGHTAVGEYTVRVPMMPRGLLAGSS